MGGSTLVKRVLTAGILIPSVIAAIFLLPTSYLALFFAIVVLLAGLEWTSLSGISSGPGKTSFMILLALSMVGIYELLAYTWFTDWFFLLIGLWWFGVAAVLISCKQIEAAAPGVSPLRTLMGFIVIVPLWASILVIHKNGNNGPLAVLFMMILIWVADSGAYFFGRRWGKRKLAPVISPGKTWEGVYGAVIGALICVFVLVWYRNSIEGIYWMIPICILTVLMSVVGDLFESMLKRKVGIKDSGTLLPGHGGILDRIDSLTAAAPIFLLGLQFVTGL